MSMKPEEAISILKSWRITGDKSHEAMNMAVYALTREDKIRQMLEAEKSRAYFLSEDYRNGRISAFYDALGANYAD